MRWLGNAHKNRTMGNRLWWLLSTTQSWASSSTSTDETTNIIKQKWMVAVILMTVLGLVRMIDSFRGRLTAITRRIIGLSTHEPPTCSITYTHSVTHSLSHSLTVSVFLSLSNDLRAASTSPTTAAITSAFDLDTALELVPGLLWGNEFAFGPEADEEEATAGAAVASENCLSY